MPKLNDEVCPKCHAMSDGYNDIEFDPGQITLEYSCFECDAEWTAIYKLQGVRIDDAGSND